MWRAGCLGSRGVARTSCQFSGLESPRSQMGKCLSPISFSIAVNQLARWHWRQFNRLDRLTMNLLNPGFHPIPHGFGMFGGHLRQNPGARRACFQFCIDHRSNIRRWGLKSKSFTRAEARRENRKSCGFAREFACTDYQRHEINGILRYAARQDAS